ncbi:hypothetical protein EVAR_45347_1 [Eumeta japonica]|uniref:Uncharacterized protein n=1 Tax=Eumeta variegata TaxID=151549 RepID=A0A4C1XZR8_EUMVA|nr:hypothetical protein EVAR_45347_1 [Eumeta japonica]
MLYKKFYISNAPQLELHSIGFAYGENASGSGSAVESIVSPRGCYCKPRPALSQLDGPKIPSPQGEIKRLREGVVLGGWAWV